MDHFYCYGEVRAIGLRTYLDQRGYRRAKQRVSISSPGSRDVWVLLGPEGSSTGYWMPGPRTVAGLSELDGEAYEASEHPQLLADLTALRGGVTEGRLHVYHEYGEQEYCVLYDFDTLRQEWLRALPVDMMVPTSLYPALQTLATSMPRRKVISYLHKPRKKTLLVELEIAPWKGPAQKEGKA